MPSLTTTRTIAASRAAASPYPHSRSCLLTTSGSSDTDEEVETTRGRSYRRKANISLTATRRSARLQAKALPTQAEYEEMKEKAELAQQELLKLEIIRTELFTCPVCLDFAYQPQITQCGHLYCATCLNGIRVHSIETQGLFTQCGLCRGDLYLPPVPCRPLQDLIESIATTDGLAIPGYVSEVWVGRPSR
ncbi:hypothetical protein DFJ43DRAFT_1151508 [Lentinula guzmanii]|uniref:RING-type E3 ubiquitin transferase n=1 Tax=Lentinula guzmanii TaxID=2804957 RepID=A0AA38JHN9_9AGAR|nr:hypothetical protein DFJ43DRAFT_1151508 [Lentinula guzmanii]